MVLLQVYSCAVDKNGSPDGNGNWKKRTGSVKRITANDAGAFNDAVSDAVNDAGAFNDAVSDALQVRLMMLLVMVYFFLVLVVGVCIVCMFLRVHCFEILNGISADEVHTHTNNVKCISNKQIGSLLRWRSVLLYSI